MRLSLFLLALACISGTEPTGPAFVKGSRTVASLTISPDTMVLHPGEVGKATCFPRNSAGVLLANTCTWKSFDTSLAKVTSPTQTTSVSAITNGNVSVSATSWNKADTMRLTIVPAPIVCDSTLPRPAPGWIGFQPTLSAITVEVLPHTASLTSTNARQTLQGSVRDACGPIVSTWTWTSRNTAIVASISSTQSAVTVVPAGNGTVYVVGTANVNGGKDSSLFTVTGQTVVTGPNINPGDDWQTAVNANPSGTTFIVVAGVHRQQNVSPKVNDRFIGDGGRAVMNGSKVLTGTWTNDGSGHYYLTGQTQQPRWDTNWACQTAHPYCYISPQLFVNDTFYEPVASAAALGAKKWWSDTLADRVWLSFNPGSAVIEESVTPTAFTGSVTGVTVKGLTIQRYAGSRPPSVVNGLTQASWLIEDDTVKDNAGSGVACGTSGHIHRGLITRSGQMGYKIQGTGCLMDSVEISYNNTHGYGTGGAGEAGGGKAANSTNVVIRGNYSHHNDGPGLWTDIDNQNTTYEGNRVDSNLWRGIFHEISYAATIKNNIVIGNGFQNPSATIGACDGAGIIISSSRDVNIFGNTVTNNLNGICNQETDRIAGPFGAHDLINVHVYSNTITQTDNGRAGGATDSDPNADPYSVVANNVWDNNTYHRTLGTTKWRWTTNADITETQWKAVQDKVGSTFGP